MTAAVDRLSDFAPRLEGRRIGLLSNAASVDARLIPTSRRLFETPGARLVRLFAPEHGFLGALQAGESDRDGVDPATGLAVVALYGARSAPEPAHLADLDLLIVDLPDVGARPYTYLSTLLKAMDACAAAGGPEVLILDRPNPLGRTVEGGGVAPGATSFVAAMDAPLRHGLTLGELARLYAAETGLPAPEVAPCLWDGAMIAADAVWVAPSPNLPTAHSALLYPGAVLVEGTALSEGRGATRPFALIGAPGLDGDALVAALRAEAHPGLLVRAAVFAPSASKHAGQTCAGIELHVADRAAYRALPPILGLLRWVAARQPELLGANAFLDRLAGGPRLRAWLDSGEPPAALLAEWVADQTRFAARAAPYRLYP